MIFFFRIAHVLVMMTPLLVSWKPVLSQMTFIKRGSLLTNNYELLNSQCKLFGVTW